MSRPGFAARREAKAQRKLPPASVQDWMAALEQGGRLARAAEDLAGVVQGAPSDLVQFRIRLNALTPESFPMPSDHARRAAAAFISGGRAFADSQVDGEARTACAPLLREATRYVDQLLTRHRDLTARRAWGGQFPDGDR